MWNNDFGKNEFLHWTAHTRYTLYSPDGHLLQQVRNTTGMNGANPTVVKLSPGIYRLKPKHGRGALRAKGMVTAADLKTLTDGRHVKIAGLVLFRQRPGTAKGTIFVTIEDETGAANLIVWPKIATQYRRAVFGAKVLLCEGVLQKESNVIHVVSRHLTDWTAMLKNFQPGRSEAGLTIQPGRTAFHSSGATLHTRKVFIRTG